MIAANFRKYADALIRQLELDLSGSQDAPTRAAWWTWLMACGKPQPLARPAATSWWLALRARCKALARSLRAAQIPLSIVIA